MNLNPPRSTPRDYLRILFRHKTVIIITLIAIMVTTYIGLELKTPVYEAHVKMLISAQKQIDSPYYKDLSSAYRDTKIALTQAEIVTSTHVLERAIKALKLQERPFDYEKNFYSPLKAQLTDLKTKWLANLKMIWPVNSEPKESETRQEPQDMVSEQEREQKREQEYRLWIATENLRRAIHVEPIRDTDLFTITVNDFSPDEAAMIANAVSRSYIICDLEQQLAELQLQYEDKHQLVLQLKDNIDKMNDNLSGVSLSYIESIGPATIKIVEQAKKPFVPIGINKHLTLTLASFIGIFLGIMFAFGLDYIDHTFKSSQDVELFLNLPFLGSIPKGRLNGKTLIKDINQINPYTQFYKHLADQIYFSMKNKKLKSIMITAASPLEGSTGITANLCHYLSKKAGRKAIIIDTNLKSPAIHKIFNIPENPGLSNVLEGEISFEEAVHNLGHNLSVLPAGKTSLDSTLLLDSTSMINVIKAAKERYEFVFVDYADLKDFQDAYVLSSYLDGVVLVVDEGKTRCHAVKTLIAPFEEGKFNLIGVILNNRTFVIPKIIYKRI